MTNPWDIDEPFTPMMTDVIGLIGKRKDCEVHTSYKACIFPLEDIEPFSDIAIDSNIKSLAIIIADTFSDNDKPQIGDEVRLQNSERFKISDIKLFGNMRKLVVRSI